MTAIDAVRKLAATADILVEKLPIMDSARASTFGNNGSNNLLPSL